MSMKYFLPSVVQYLANSTILSDVISFYVPFVRTIIVVFKYKNLCTVAEREWIVGQEMIVKKTQEEKEMERKLLGKNSGRMSSKLNTSSGRGLFSMFSTSSSLGNEVNEKKKGKSHVANAYTKAASQGKPNKTLMSSSSSIVTNINRKKQKKVISPPPTILQEDELNEISIEAAELLKYWIVYAILTALIQTAALLPIMGRIFYNANPTNTKKAAASMSRWSKRNSSKARLSYWLEKIKLSTGFLEECKLFFFAWLRLLPISLTSSSSSSSSKNSFDSSISSGSSGDVKNRIKALEKKAKYSTSTQKSTTIRRKTFNSDAPYSNQPLDIIYDKLAPIVISLVSTSTNFVNDTNRTYGGSSDSAGAVVDPLQAFKAKCATFARTMLEAMVWTKIISESRKNSIIIAFLQCTSILPAAITMVMPSYFTNYGIIYVRLMVPSANSSSSYDAFVALKEEVGVDGSIIDPDNGLVSEKWIDVSSNINRFLQYWIIQAIVSSIVMSFAPVLAWVPLSTHMTWLLWAYVQLESTTKKLYNTLEWDLVAFGILKKTETMLNGDRKVSGDDDAKEIDVNDTTSMQLLNSIIKKVPANITASNSVTSLSKTEKENEKNCGEALALNDKGISSEDTKLNDDSKLSDKSIED